ncbi:MAG: M20/M25/M40 family metallo-hydrolase [Bacteroidota bacterium]
MTRLSFILFFLLSNNVFSQYSVPKSILKQIESIDSNAIKKHVTFLADDQLKGRYPGSEGYQMAVDYVVNQFKSLNITPAGEKNSYLQKVQLRNSKLVKNHSSITVDFQNGKTKNLVLGEDLIIFPHPEQKSITINAPLVFVGAGFDSPQFGFNDYNRLDVKGKIVVIMRKTPENVSENVKRHLTYNATYQDFAAKNGAIGVLLCNYANSVAQFKVLAKSTMEDGIKASINDQGLRVSSSNHVGGKIQLMGRITVQALKEIMNAETDNFDKIWQKLENGQYVSMPMKSTIHGQYESAFNDIISYNLIGKIEGSDRKLKNEYVIHSGHLDHIGITKPVNGDSINNGAHDNASGIACSLEIARMYSEMKVKPKRSILFVFVTAEEMGLLGSGYFVANPTVPKNKIVADINTDMPTIIAPFESAAPLGAEHSSLQKTVEQAAKLLNIYVETDPEPTEGRFVRSDQYNFLKGGIPALHIKYGYKFSNPALGLAEKVKIFRENHYHKPSDEVNDSFVWAAGRKFAQLNFLVSYIVAQSKTRPNWNKGDFFNPIH